MTHMNQIGIGWMSHCYYVSDEDLEKILPLIKELAGCKRCGQRFSEKNPNAAGSLCLECLLGGHRYLSYLKTERNTLYYLGHNEASIYLSIPGPGKPEKAEYSEIETIRYWGFPVPAQMDINGKKIEIQWCWLIGDPKGEIIIIHCMDVHKKNEAYFAVSKNGKAIQINARKKAHRELLSEAKKIDQYHEHCGLVKMLNENAELRQNIGLEEKPPLLIMPNTVTI